MSHKHAHLLREIFHDPINTNIHWREIESLLKHLGADVEPLSGARIRVKLGHAEGSLHRPHHGPAGRGPGHAARAAGARAVSAGAPERVVLASANPKKVAELSAVFVSHNFQVAPPSSE